MSSSAPPDDREVLRRSVAHLLDRLPDAWATEVHLDERFGHRRVDALVDISAPGGERATLLVEAKPALVGKDVSQAVAQAWSHIDALGRPATPVLVSRYLSPSVQERLTASDVAYADATGNLRLTLDRPALFVRDIGERSDPWRGPGRPRGDLKGRSAARIVRALVDFRPPYSLPELSLRSGASVGATYRMIDFLEREALVAREERGPIVAVEWRRLLLRWAEQFRTKAPPLRGCLEPRGLDALIAKLKERGDKSYVVTGSLAAAFFAPYAPPRLGVVYAEDPTDLVERLELRETERGANVLIGAPLDRVMLERSIEIDGLRVACPSQIAADLLVSPGRGPEEAEALMDWMETNESAWRR